MGGKLFPEYLNKGSEGDAVLFLLCVLKMLGFNRELIVLDRVYGDEAEKGVKQLQIYLKERGYDIDIDGNFGPKTRKAFATECGVDINSIPLFNHGTVGIGPEGPIRIEPV